MITVPSMFGTESPIGCHSFALKFSLTISTSSGFTRYDRFPPFQGKKKHLNHMPNLRFTFTISVTSFSSALIPPARSIFSLPVRSLHSAMLLK